MERKFTMVIERRPDRNCMYVGSIPGIPAAHTQGKTICSSRIRICGNTHHGGVELPKIPVLKPERMSFCRR